MREINRQFVLFGSFKQINQNSPQVKQIEKDFGFSMGLIPIPPAQNIDINQPPFFQPIPIPMKPILVSADSKTRVLFGDDRIHVEQFDMEIESYAAFADLAQNILKIIFDSGMIVNRIAANGQIESDNQKEMDELFSKFFNKSNYYCGQSDEWDMRVNSTEASPGLKQPVNKITAHSKIPFGHPNLPPTYKLMKGYDYSTLIQSDKKFSFADMVVLMKEANEFRGLFKK